MRFEFATSNRIIFGLGTFSEVGAVAAELGDRALVVSGITIEQTRSLLNMLSENGIDSEFYLISEEPTVSVVQQGVDIARDAKSNLIIGFGGGSAIDTGKAIAALVTNKGDILDYLEVIGGGKSIKKEPLPYIAIPTTAGTGAEVTRNAVIGSTKHRVKVSLRSPLMLPNIAIVDPELTYSLPPQVTASTGMDALTQVLEPYVSIVSNPLTDALCKEGIQYAAKSLLRAYRDGNDRIARQGMALVSLFGGLALANANLGAVHGFAGPLGGMYDAPHGAICARLLPPVMSKNVEALKSRGIDRDLLRRYDEVGTLLTGDTNAIAGDGVHWVYALSKKLDIPPLSEYGVRREDFPSIIDKASQSSSMKGNSVELSQYELSEILEQAL